MGVQPSRSARPASRFLSLMVLASSSSGLCRANHATFSSSRPSCSSTMQTELELVLVLGPVMAEDSKRHLEKSLTAHAHPHHPSRYRVRWRPFRVPEQHKSVLHAFVEQLFPGE